MAGVERHVFALAGGRDIIDIVARQPGIGQHRIKGFLGQDKRIALAHPVVLAFQPFDLFAFDPEQNGLDGAGADVYAY